MGNALAVLFHQGLVLGRNLLLQLLYLVALKPFSTSRPFHVASSQLCPSPAALCDGSAAMHMAKRHHIQNEQPNLEL